MAITKFKTLGGSTTSSNKLPLFKGSATQYDSPKLHRYPIDLGVASKEHYMIIHVNEQTRTQFAGELASGDLPTILANRRLYGGSTVFASTVVPSLEWAAGLDQAKEYTGVANFQTIRRTKDTIALYMPDTLNFGYDQHYDELKLTGGITAAIAGGASLADSFKGVNLNSVSGSQVLSTLGRNVSPFVLSLLAQKEDLFRAAFGGFFGFVQNPQLELIYTSPKFREFNFEFMFYPRSESEAKEVQNILATLKFHQAPEVVKEYRGFFLVPPSEFDIKFYYNGVENPNMPKISTCILQSINVDYAPHGFAAYENVSSSANRGVPTRGETGMPVAIRLSLRFKEKEILTKAHFADDAGRNSGNEGE